MYPFIVCFCGRSLGDLYDAFKIMRLQKYSEAYAEAEIDVDPAILAITEPIQVDLSDVYKQLNIHTDCCKVKLATQVEFKSVY